VRISRRRSQITGISPDRWPHVHAEWVDAIDAHSTLGSDRARITEYTADVVETLFVRLPGISGALSRFGTRVGAEGWSLENESEWIDLLVAVCPDPPANSLRSFPAGVALAHGWTDGHLRGMRSGECFDAVTGLCAPRVLRLRLEQLYEQCSARVIEPHWAFGIVIIDADIDEVGKLEADAVMVVLADLVQRRFPAAAAIARDGGRILVLTRRTDALTDDINSFVGATLERGLLQAARILVWLEDLPPRSTDIPRYMADLTI
jgi:GGDEF domain-containing protein